MRICFDSVGNLAAGRRFFSPFFKGEVRLAAGGLFGVGGGLKEGFGLGEAGHDAFAA